MNRGFVHLYWGDGKGKTTAAMGLALRALGAGLSVTVVQFLKDGESAELAALRNTGAAVYSAMPSKKFLFQMTAEEQADLYLQQTEMLKAALEQPCDLLILDEVCAAWQLNTIDRNLLQQAVCNRPAEQEIVLTGREPADWMFELAEYSTRMKCYRHPYENGIPAREGIEF